MHLEEVVDLEKELDPEQDLDLEEYCLRNHPCVQVCKFWMIVVMENSDRDTLASSLFGKSQEEHDKHLAVALKKIQRVGLILNKEKC